MNDKELDNYIEAGRIAKTVLHACAAEIKTGVALAEIFDMVLDKISSAGAFHSFPPNISLNNCAAHDTASPDEERTFAEGDLVKLDIGTHIDGYIADTAVTVDLGDHTALCDASRLALEAAIKVVAPGVVVSDIGAVIEETTTSYGYKPVINLTGHALARYSLHHGLSIPNTGKFGSAVLREDMVIAIEPFASSGSGQVHETPRGEIYQAVGNTPVRSPAGRKILKQVEVMHGLPFARRWLNVPRAELALPNLLRQGNLYVYHCLSDVPDCFVSQFEHTIIVTADGALVTTR